MELSMIRHSGKCSFGGCKSDSRYKHMDYMKGVFFVRFPIKKPKLCKRWVAVCGRKEFTFASVKRHTVICSLHFIGGQGPTAEHPDPVSSEIFDGYRQSWRGMPYQHFRIGIADKSDPETTCPTSIISAEVADDYQCAESRYCRTCASKDQFFIPIFETDSGGYYNVHKVIETYLPIKVSKRDKLPLQVCQRCYETLKAWDELFGDVLFAEKRLRKILFCPKMSSAKSSAEEASKAGGSNDAFKKEGALIRVRDFSKKADIPTDVSCIEMKQGPLDDNASSVGVQDGSVRVDESLMPIVEESMSGNGSQELESGVGDMEEPVVEATTAFRSVAVWALEPECKLSDEADSYTAEKAKVDGRIPSYWLDQNCGENASIEQPLTCMQSNSNKPRYNSSQCPEPFYSEVNYTHHLEDHKRTFTKKFKCRNCFRTFKQNARLRKHEEMCGVT